MAGGLHRLSITQVSANKATFYLLLPPYHHGFNVLFTLYVTDAEGNKGSDSVWIFQKSITRHIAPIAELSPSSRVT